MTLYSILLTIAAITGTGDAPPLGDYFGFSRIDSIKIGEEELPFITGTNNIDLSLTKLLKYNISNIIWK